MGRIHQIRPLLPVETADRLRRITEGIVGGEYELPDKVSPQKIHSDMVDHARELVVSPRSETVREVIVND